MLIPKMGLTNATIPTLMDFSEAICPPERRALREIVETAEVVKEGDHLYLVARVSAATLDSLATFETAREDLEEDNEPSIGSGSGGYEVDAELDDCDDEPEPDEGPDAPGLRRRFIAERHKPPRELRYVNQDGRECRTLIPSRYDATKDQDEMRKTKRQLSTLAAKKRKRVKA